MIDICFLMVVQSNLIRWHPESSGWTRRSGRFYCL